MRPLFEPIFSYICRCPSQPKVIFFVQLYISCFQGIQRRALESQLSVQVGCGVSLNLPICQKMTIPLDLANVTTICTNLYIHLQVSITAKTNTTYPSRYILLSGIQHSVLESQKIVQVGRGFY